jgi:hypothetical protein
MLLVQIPLDILLKILIYLPKGRHPIFRETPCIIKLCIAWLGTKKINPNFLLSIQKLSISDNHKKVKHQLSIIDSYISKRDWFDIKNDEYNLYRDYLQALSKNSQTALILRKLKLPREFHKDLALVSNFSNLTHLKINNAPIDATILQLMPKLSTLHVAGIIGCPIETFLPNIQHLNLKYGCTANEPIHFVPLNSKIFPNLEIVVVEIFGWNSNWCIDWLMDFPFVKIIEIGHLWTTNVVPLKIGSMPLLTRLTLGNNILCDFENFQTKKPTNVRLIIRDKIPYKIPQGLMKVNVEHNLEICLYNFMRPIDFDLLATWNIKSLRFDHCNAESISASIVNIKSLLHLKFYSSNILCGSDNMMNYLNGLQLESISEFSNLYGIKVMNTITHLVKIPILKLIHLDDDYQKKFIDEHTLLWEKNHSRCQKIIFRYGKVKRLQHYANAVGIEITFEDWTL